MSESKVWEITYLTGRTGSASAFVVAESASRAIEKLNDDRKRESRDVIEPTAVRLIGACIL